jgi:hypothetical protein
MHTLEQSFNYKAKVANLGFRVLVTYEKSEPCLKKVPVNEILIDEWERFNLWQPMPDAAIKRFWRSWNDTLMRLMQCTVQDWNKLHIY